MPASTTRRTPCPLALLAASVTALSLGAAACGGYATDASQPADAHTNVAVATAQAGERLQYGTPIAVGEGKARTYVRYDATTGNVPVEIGVALDERALDGLPAPMPMPAGSEHMEDMHEYRLALPPNAPAPYKFVELDWNPAGHSAPYHAKPHFDFHFWMVPLADRNAIDRSDPQFAQKAANFPAPQYMPAGYFCPCALLGLPADAVAVERMGVHWIDLASPEYVPPFDGFTRTHIVGTWDGRVIFQEPMITREFIAGLAGTNATTRDVTVPVPVAAAFQQAGWYPAAYRVRYDAQAKEYRVALTNLAWRE